MDALILLLIIAIFVAIVCGVLIGIIRKWVPLDQPWLNLVCAGIALAGLLIVVSRAWPLVVGVH
jgi:hypothetical protein